MADHNRRRVLTIDGLPDDDLLAIFDFYVVRYQYLDFREVRDYKIKRRVESWQSLVHVCRRWRCLVFGSPRSLDLQLCCTIRTPARKLDVWPALPLLIQGPVSKMSVGNVFAVLKHNDRIRQIDLECDRPTSYNIEKLLIAMQVPFPKLAVLRLSPGGPLSGFLPDSFLGGSAPSLQYLWLANIPFPGLPKLLLSATHLVQLRLQDITHPGYIPPEDMATSLSILTCLEKLHIGFASTQSYPDLKSRRLPPPTRSVIPTLKTFGFNGVNEYLEKFLARIDAPRLYRLRTTIFNDIDFNTPELNQFISRTPTLGAYNEARLIFDSRETRVSLRQSRPEPSGHKMVEIRILGQESDRQLSTLAKICTSSLRLLLTMENLYIHGNQYSPLIPRGDIENTTWLDLLLPFTAVKNLYLSKLFSPPIARALQELTGGRTTEVLPALQNVFLEGFQSSKPVQRGIARFISAQQLANHPVAISVWDRSVVGG